MSTKEIITIAGGILAAITAAGIVIKFTSKKNSSVVQKDNKLSSGSQMAGRDINNK